MMYSGYVFRLCIQAMHSGYAFRLCIQAMHSSYSFRLSIQAIHSGYAFRLCIQAMHSGFLTVRIFFGTSAPAGACRALFCDNHFFKDRSKSRFDSGFVIYAKFRAVHNRDLVGRCFLRRVMAEQR